MAKEKDIFPKHFCQVCEFMSFVAVGVDFIHNKKDINKTLC